MHRVCCIFMLVISINYAEANLEINEFNTSKARIVDHEAAKLIIAKKEFLQKLFRAKECEKKWWYCKKSCYEEPAFATDFKKQKFLPINANTTTCFGNRIMYNFTAEDNNQFTIEHLSVLKNFPICWEMIAPFICETQFRPWQAILYETHEQQNQVKASKIMKIYSMESCKNVRGNCSFLKRYGINLKQLNCEGSSTDLSSDETLKSALRRRRLLFSSKSDCKIENSTAMTFTKPACFEPLVEVKNMTSHLNSIVDGCYLGCKTSFAKSEQVNFLHYSVLAFSLILAVVFLSTAVYTFFHISFGYEQKIMKFLALLMFINSGLLNLAIFMVLLLSTFFEVCTNNNHTLIRVELESDLNFCTITWFILTVLLVASFLSFTLFMCQWILKPYGLLNSLEQWLNERKSAEITALLCLLIYVLAFAMPFVMNLKAETPGGMVNMCYILLDPIDSNCIFYYFLLLMVILVFVAFVLRISLVFINSSKKNSINGVQEEELQLEVCIEVPDEQPDQQNSTTRNQNSKVIVWRITFCAVPIALGAMFIMNHSFRFDYHHERFEIDQKIRCVLNQITQYENESATTAFIETKCSFPSASNWDIAYLFAYAFVLPMVPFIITFLATLFGQKALEIYKKSEWTEIKKVGETPNPLRSSVPDSVAGRSDIPCSVVSHVQSLPASRSAYEKRYPYKEKGLKKSGNTPLLPKIDPGNNCAWIPISLPQYRALCAQHHAVCAQYQAAYMQLQPILQNAILPIEDAQIQSTQTLQTLDSQQSTQTLQTLDSQQSVDSQRDSDDFDSDASAGSEEKRILGIKVDSSSEHSSSEESEKDSTEEQLNPIVYEIGRYLKTNKIESKMRFYTLALEKFHVLFENDPKFKTACTVFLNADPQNPERKTINENHIITKEEMFLLTNGLKLDKDVKRLCKLAIDQAVSDFKANNIP